MKNIPIEYSIYRVVKSISSIIEIPLNLKNEIINKYKINEELFDKIEEKFISQIITKNFKYYKTYFSNYRLINIESIRDYENQINKLNCEISNKDNEINRIKSVNNKLISSNNELITLNNKILNSKWWKLRKILFWKK